VARLDTLHRAQDAPAVVLRQQGEQMVLARYV
jgi:hypothetical protein